LKKKYQISIQDAQNTLDAFRDNAYNTFEKHELIVIPQVGRLYRDFNSKIQFLPDTTNFNTDTFGLPTAQFYPVSRTLIEKAAVAEALKNDAPPPTASIKSFPETTTNIPFPTTTIVGKPQTPAIQWSKFILGLTIAVLFIMMFSIYMHNQNKEKFGTKTEKPKVNVSPTKPENNAPSGNSNVPTPVPPSVKPPDKTIAHDKMLNNTPKTEGVAKDNQEGQNALSTAPLSAPKTNKARVILGGFGDKNNISRHKKWLAANGYVIYEKPSGSILILGADVAYSDKQDLQRTVAKLESRFGAEAVKVQRAN
jgi:hypothetical protein